MCAQSSCAAWVEEPDPATPAFQLFLVVMIVEFFLFKNFFRCAAFLVMQVSFTHSLS
jgi:hypothetical protein